MTRSLRALLLSVPLATLLALPALGSGWAPTATQAISLANAVSAGSLPGSTVLHLVIGLAPRNQSNLQQYVAEINDPSNPLFGESLSVDEFVASYAPTPDQVQAVTGYLAQAGLTNIQVEANDLLVTADGSASVVQLAFNVQIGQFLQNGQTVYANTTPAMVPGSLSGLVTAVLGLNNAAVMTTPHAYRPATGVPNYLISYTPQQLWEAYDVGSTSTGKNTTIAIFAEGDLTQVLADLRTAEAANHLPAVPVTVVPVGIPSTDTSGADEWDLDTQISTGMAGTVKSLLIYDTTSLTDSDVALMFNRFAAQNKAKAGSASFGLCEALAFADGSMLVDDMVFLEAAAQGQTVFASTGDSGSACAIVGVANGVPLSGGIGMVEYPASSPYVVAVGGTTLLTNPDYSYGGEIAWNAGGGGVSAFDYSEYWQSGIVPGSAAGKGLPDIAMDADPESGATVYVSGAPEGIGGTSLSSPLALGVWARLQSAHSNRLGFASPLLYAHAVGLPVPSSPQGFHDVVLGGNGLFTALPGWDYTTGLGSFDVSVINMAIGH